MDSQQSINHRQMAWCVGVLIMAGGLMILPKTLIKVATTDAWLANLLGSAYGLLVAYILYRLAARFPQKNLFEIIFLLCGKWVGRLLACGLIFYFWTILIRDTRIFVDFMNTTLLPRTPSEIITYLLIIVLIYYGRTSIEVAVRVNDFVYPMFLIVMFVLPLLLANEYSFQRIEPLLGQGFRSIIASNLLSMGWFADVLIVGAFLGMISNAKQMMTSMRHGILFASLGLTVVLFSIIAVLGSRIGGRFIYPTYMLVEQIHITDFLDRMELLLFSIWLPAFMIKMIIIFIALQIGVAQLCGQRDYTVLARPIGWFILLTTLAGFNNVAEVINFGNFGALVVILAVQPLVLGVLLIRSRKHKPIVGTELSKGAKPQVNSQSARKGLVGKGRSIRARTFFWWSNVLVGAGGASILLGALVGSDYSVVGVLCAVLYALFILLAAVTSIFEMLQAKAETRNAAVDDSFMDKEEQGRSQ